MSVLLESVRHEVRGSTSPIGFKTTGNGPWPVWHRYLTVGGRDAYLIGNVCNTCEFFFERMEGATGSVDVGELAIRLAEGVESLTRDLVGTLAAMMPDGVYEVLSLRTAPRPVTLGTPDDYFASEQQRNWGLDAFWGLPHHPKVPYYRGGDRAIGAEGHLFEFVAPTYPRSGLEPDRLAFYRDRLGGGRRPTALAVSVLDVKGPALLSAADPREDHWCLAHYLLDGHHKVEAAAVVGQQVSLISFLARGRGVCSEADVDTVLGLLGRAGPAVRGADERRRRPATPGRAAPSSPGSEATAGPAAGAAPGPAPATPRPAAPRARG